MNVGRALVERLPCLERDGRLALHLHDDLAFEHVDERMGVVPVDHVLCARRIRHLDHETLLARVVREIDREQFLHVCGFGRDGGEHQECRQASAEVGVECLHVVPFRSWSGQRIRLLPASGGASRRRRVRPPKPYPAGLVITTRIGVGLNPLHGLCTCGQFETTARTRVSARSSTESPGFALPSTMPMVPSANTGTFMKKLMLATMSFSPMPCRASARRKLA